MGEYATRVTDGQRIKIGTCAMMYYLRYEDRNLVTRCSGSLDPATQTDLFWRLPLPKEDEVLPGDYTGERGARLYRADGEGGYDRYTNPALADQPGRMQLRHDCGLLISVPCYHGEKLPDIQGASWNGKSWFYELIAVKNTSAGPVLPIIQCRFCHSMWRQTWAEILPYIGEMTLRARLAAYAR